MQSMNGVNLFRFDGDLTWMAFFMDAEDHIYTRYGGRGDSGPETLLSKTSLQKVMRQVLRLHQAHQVQLPDDNPGRVPEDIPNLRARLAKNKSGHERCIH